MYSIIIITFKRDDALLDNLGDLKAKLKNRADIEVVLVDNNEDEVDRSHMLSGFLATVYCKLKVNRGVAGGRNEGVKRSSGKYLVFLDDDAFIGPDDFPNRVGELFACEPKVGIIAFRSINYYTGDIDRVEFPHTDKKRNPEVSFKTFRFIGVGHAIRRDIFDSVGLYDEEFFYAMEEFDLSYRAIKAGFQILYTPSVHVLHKKNASGRMPSSGMIEQTLLNKLRVNYMHLPFSYMLVSGLLWFGYSFYRSRGSANLLRVWRKYRIWVTSNQKRRQPFGVDARRYLTLCGARLWS